jgi:hypothetical protein
MQEDRFLPQVNLLNWNMTAELKTVVGHLDELWSRFSRLSIVNA